MVLNVLAQLYLLFRIVDHHFRHRTANWFAILIVVANTFYLTQSYRVRSDLLATTLFLGTIFAFTKFDSPRKRLLTLVVGAAAVLLATPKAIFLMPILVLIYVFEYYDKRKRLYALAFIASLMAVYLACVFLRLGALSDMVLDLQNYLLTTLNGGETGMPYMSRKSLEYVNKMFQENAWVAIVWLLPYIFIHKTTNRKWLAVHTYLLALLFLAPEKLPFFICSLLPLLACSTILLVTPFFIKTKTRISSILMVCTVLAISFMASWKIMKFLHSDSNREQIAAVRAIDNYLNTYSELRYYDVIGLSPAHSYFRHFAGPNQLDSNKLVAKTVADEKPDVLMKVAKFDYLGETMINLLKNDYIDVGNGIYVRSFPVPENLQQKDAFMKIQNKKELSFVSPLFEKFQHDDLVFETRDEKGMRGIFTSIENLRMNMPKSKIFVVKVSPIPMPQKLPPRHLHELFKFDSEF